MKIINTAPGQKQVAKLISAFKLSPLGCHSEPLRGFRVVAFALLTPFFFLRAGTLISAPALVTGAGVIGVLLLVKLAAKLVGVFTTPEQWKSQAIVIDHKLRAEKTAEWRKWFAENVMN